MGAPMNPSPRPRKAVVRTKPTGNVNRRIKVTMPKPPVAQLRRRGVGGSGLKMK